MDTLVLILNLFTELQCYNCLQTILFISSPRWRGNNGFTYCLCCVEEKPRLVPFSVLCMRKITLRTDSSQKLTDENDFPQVSQRIKSFMKWMISRLLCAHEQYSVQRKMKKIDLPLESLVKAIMRKATEATNSIKHKTMRYFSSLVRLLKWDSPV